MTHVEAVFVYVIYVCMYVRIVTVPTINTYILHIYVHPLSDLGPCPTLGP